jgi:hypothetical protein
MVLTELKDASSLSLACYVSCAKSRGILNSGGGRGEERRIGEPYILTAHRLPFHSQCR